MNLLNFTHQFPDEASRKSKRKEYRDKQGIVCPHCDSREHYWNKQRENYECKHCGYRQSLKTNTVMHGSQLPYRYRFVAIHLLTSTKKSFSASELQRQLRHSTYNPIWAMLHKKRQVMGQCDACYQLAEILELDEDFFSTEMDESKKHKPLKHGRSSQKKSKVPVMAESLPLEGGPTTKDGKLRKVGYIKMFVMEDLKAETIDRKVIEHIDKDAVGYFSKY